MKQQGWGQGAERQENATKTQALAWARKGEGARLTSVLWEPAVRRLLGTSSGTSPSSWAIVLGQDIKMKNMNS